MSRVRLIGLEKRDVAALLVKRQQLMVLDMRKQHGTHANLATASFGTTAADHEVEAQRFLDELEKEAKADI